MRDAPDIDLCEHLTDRERAALYAWLAGGQSGRSNPPSPNPPGDAE